MTIPLTSSMWRWYSAFGVAAIIVLAFFVGCLNSSSVSRTVYDEPLLLVRLDSPLGQEEVPIWPEGHNMELTAADVATLLQSVKIQPDISFFSYWILRKEPHAEPAFLNEDVLLLASHVGTALAKARVNETVVFVLRRAREDGIPIITTGGVLIHGDQLVVLLANARRPITTQRKLDSAREAPLIPLGEPDFHIVPGPFQTSLTTKDFPKHIAMKPAPALSINYRALLASFAQPSRGSVAPQAGAEIPAATMEEKLHRLKTWHEQGLITDDEYRYKRQELLKQF